MQQFGADATVLIIDDDPDLLPALTDIVRLLSQCQVVTATNGVAGLEQFYAVRPTCAIIDVNMPGMDGYQLVRALRGEPATAETPLILLTALVQDRDRFAGLAAALLGAYIIVIALSGVMANATFMFATVVAMNALGAAVCFVAPLHPAPAALGVWLSSSLEEWTAALLVFGAQQLYVRALHELGDIRLAYERAQKLDERKDQFIRNVPASTSARHDPGGDGTAGPDRGAGRRAGTDGARACRSARAGRSATPATGLHQPALERGEIFAVWLTDHDRGDIPHTVRIQTPEVSTIPAGRDHGARSGLGHSAGSDSVALSALRAVAARSGVSDQRHGLGLHLCKVLIEAMGGTIWVESSGVAGEGATFHIVLKQAQP